ncbi:hypothetical protein SUDANB120_02997 [Streptomyces sp. enrichment culture]
MSESTAPEAPADRIAAGYAFTGPALELAHCCGTAPACPTGASVFRSRCSPATA